MRVAYYAPLKPPDHPVPSGDRRMARLLAEALRRAGHEVELASRLRSRDDAGDPARQARIARLGAALAERLVRRYRAAAAGARPRAWLTYHAYYKAPDWIGPRVSEALGIPYVLAEASLAPKRADGPWALGHRATLEALERARMVIALNPADVPCLPDRHRVEVLAPFLDPAPFRAAAARREAARAGLATAHGLDPARPWLLAVAMMRPGDKLASYRLLAEALRRAGDLSGESHWHLLIAGDGPARDEVAAAFAWVPAHRVLFLGARDGDDLPGVYAACDLLAWPALNEAYGMALLEAQAAGLPVLAGAAGGVAAVVRDGTTGVLVPPGDSGAFATALRDLLAAPARRRSMGAAALAAVAAGHDLDRAARRLDATLRRAVSA
ncbi:MAG: glycosyltransferase family 4 protein [Kiloniellaceae bacterium]